MTNDLTNEEIEQLQKERDRARDALLEIELILKKPPEDRDGYDWESKILRLAQRGQQ